MQSITDGSGSSELGARLSGQAEGAGARRGGGPELLAALATEAAVERGVEVAAVRVCWANDGHCDSPFPGLQNTSSGKHFVGEGATI